MAVKALGISIGDRRVGVLYEIRSTTTTSIRFVVDENYANNSADLVLSLSMCAKDPESQKALWAQQSASVFNGAFSEHNGWLLPMFFQGLLPEGIFRDHVAALRRCDPKDHFEMLAACGLDLPGNIYARPLAEVEAAALGRYVTIEAPLELTDPPIDKAVSLSGVQPKLGVLKEGQRYVGRTKLHDTHIIAKLPVVSYAHLPELEHLSLQLASVCGVEACETSLEPLSALQAEHGYDLSGRGGDTLWLAVKRFDRSPSGRIHVEDFCQIMGRAPEAKYQGSYLEVAAILMSLPSMGEEAVHELLRRIVVNELFGNSDMHLKNMGVIYRDGKTPELSPAYDMVGYSAYHPRHGHALHVMPTNLAAKPRVKATGGAHLSGKPGFTPYVLRQFCSSLDLPEKPAAGVVRDVVRRAFEAWPDRINASLLSEQQKSNLLNHLKESEYYKSLAKRKYF